MRQRTKRAVIFKTCRLLALTEPMEKEYNEIGSIKWGRYKSCEKKISKLVESVKGLST